MAIKTPPLRARGVYKLLEPWTIPADTIFECIAVRRFADFVESGQKIFETIYQPMGLLQSDFEADKAAGASIVTLVSPTLATIHVPDTYIEEFPNLGGVAYKHVILAVSLGPIPDALDLTFLKTQVAGTVSDVIGVTPTVELYAAPSTGVITDEEHEILETARTAAVNNRKTDRARILELQAINGAQATKIAGLEQILKDNGIIPAA